MMAQLGNRGRRVTGNRLRAFLGRFGLLLLWLAFGPITAGAVRSPGLGRVGEITPYPWDAALITWGILGLEAAVFYLILRSGRRLPRAFGLAALLWVVGSVNITSIDFVMPGPPGVLVLYQFGLTVSLGIAWAVTRRRDRSNPARTAD